MSRLARLSNRAYGRLTPKQRAAVDVLRYARPDAAGRGEAKTILGWRRTSEETTAYARKLIAEGMMPGAAALRLGVEPGHLRRLLKKGLPLENRARKPFARLEKSGLTDKRQGVGRVGPRRAQIAASELTDKSPNGDRPVYGGDPFAYDLEAAFGRAGRA
jgi:hypothetical protein